MTYQCYAQIDSALQNLHQLADKNSASVVTSTNQYGIHIGNKISNHDSSVVELQRTSVKYLTNASNGVIQYTISANKKTTQVDSAAKDLQQIPVKYIKDIDGKMDKYTSRANKQTEKTLEHLSKWETKLQPELEETDPQAAQKLFGNDQMTFTSLLQKYQSGESITSQYGNEYNAYNDKMTTQLKYLEQQKGKLDSNLVKPLSDANGKMAHLNEEEDKDAAVQQFIKQRRQQLRDATIQYIGNSPYLAKIDKESFYYVETLKNYKEIFSDPEKTEKLATDVIDKIPAYQNFMVRNSQLALMFGLSSNNSTSPGTTTDTVGLSGLQSKASIQSTMQDKISTGGPNAQQVLSQNMQVVQTQLTQIKNQLNQTGSSTESSTMSDFTPNMQKTKTLLQRFEFGTNFQTVHSTTYFPATSSIGLSLGYKLNDKTTIGIGTNYNIGWGKDISHINISSQGIGVRSFVELKLKGSIWASGGFEMNYQNEFTDIKVLNNYSSWQRSGLIGLCKKYKVGKQNCTMQLLFDFLSYQQVPRTPPILFRTGYTF
jgi:hypothetical protein